MKILVPIDFSKCSYDALSVALNLATNSKDEITLLHVIENNRIIGHLDEEQIKHLSQLSAEKIEKIIQEHTSIPGSIQGLVQEGNLIDVIANKNVQEKYDLIIMGSHGASGKKEWFIGSNTQKVIRKIDTNTLVVKNKISLSEFKEVAFVTGLNSADLEAFSYFIRFIKPFNLKKIHVLNIDTMFYLAEPSNLKSKIINDFKTIAKEYACKVVFYKDYSVDAGVRHFTKDNNIDLIAISNHVRHPVKRLFQGSNVELIINHSSVPVLSIDFKK